MKHGDGDRLWVTAISRGALSRAPQIQRDRVCFVPVAILSTPTFDARTVNPTSVLLAGAQVKVKGTPMASFQDVNGDGLLDLEVHVSTEALELSGSDVRAFLEAKTFGAAPVIGSDVVKIVP